MDKHILVSQAKHPVQEFYKKRVNYFYGANVESVKFDDKTGEMRRISEHKRNDKNGLYSKKENQLNSGICPPMSITNRNKFEGQFLHHGKNSTMKFVDLKQGGQLSFIPAMSFRGTFKAGYDPDLGAVGLEIPYEGEDVSLILISPGKMSKYKPESLGQIEAEINIKSWESLLKSFMSRSLDLQIPLFNSQSLLELNQTLIDIGLNNAFSLAADFSGINGAKDLKLSSFRQSNEFSINADLKNIKKKLEVEAHVQKIKSRARRGILHYNLKFDRQFMFIVRHNPSGLILYIGHNFPQAHIKQTMNNQR